MLFSVGGRKMPGWAEGRTRRPYRRESLETPAPTLSGQRIWSTSYTTGPRPGSKQEAAGQDGGCALRSQDAPGLAQPLVRSDLRPDPSPHVPVSSGVK